MPSKRRKSIEFVTESTGLLAMTDVKPKGGARPGAGRKPKWAAPATKVMRVPEAYAGAIRALIRHLDETQEIRRGDAPVASEQTPIRSLAGRAQYLEFTVSPRETPREIQEELDL